MAAEIAYIVKGFPRLSETFISNEVLLLEQMGVRLKLFSVKRPEEGLEQRTVSAIRSELEYLPPVTSLSNTGLIPWLWCNLPLYWRCHARLVARAPLRYLRTAAAVVRMTVVYRERLVKPKKVFIKEFIQAGYIACRVLESRDIRHLHAHFCHGATTIALFVNRLTGVPFSFTAHAKDIYQVDQNPGNLLLEKIKACSFVATCTGANKHHLDGLNGGTPVHRIYHGLDVSYFRPARRPERSPIPEILAVGRFVEKKGFRHLVDACSKLRNRGIPFRCRIIGERGDQYQPLQQWIETLGLEQQVVLEGAKSHDELLPIYRQAAIFALPCRLMDNGDRDGIPNVLVEAMACGLAVVSTNISGIPELIEHEHNGLLVAERKSDELAEALQRLLADRSLADRLADNARRTVCERFDSRRTTEELKRLFDESIVRGPSMESPQEEVSRVQA